MTTTLDNAAQQHDIDFGWDEDNPEGSTELGVEDASQIVDQNSATIHPSQLLRELIHNGMHASKAYRQAVVRLIAVMRHGAPKFAVLDTGCGMSPDELPNLVGKLAASKEKGKGRHGFGTKIVCARLSPVGLEFITWNGHDAPCGIRLFRNSLGKDRVTKVELVALDTLPAEILKAGHGTLVVVHGHSLKENSFETVTEATGATNLKGLQQFINEHYATIPKNVKISVRTLRHHGGDPTLKADCEERWTGNVGTLGALDMAKEISGTFKGKGYEIDWFVRKPGKLEVRSLGHGDGALFSGFITVAVEDGEIEGLWENYEVHKGDSKLAQFGLRPLSKKVALVVRITDPKGLKFEVNNERSGVFQDGKAFDLGAIATAFRESMPAELAKRVEAEASVNRRDPNTFREWGVKNLKWLDPKGLRQVLIPNAGGRARLLNSLKAKKRSAAQSGTKTAGAGKARGGQGGGSGWAPNINVEAWKDAGEENKFTFGMWDSYRQTLMFNENCVEIDRELMNHLSERGGAKSLSETDIKIARDVVLDAFICAALEAILCNLNRMKAQPGVWDACMTPQAITMAAATGIQRRKTVSTAITKATGVAVSSKA